MHQPRRILYIDDDAGIRRLVEKQLGRRGHTVVTAASGAQGVERAREGGFDLIAVDHYMPDMDGLQTLETLRQEPECPPVVYVTGSEESRIAVAALKAGAYEYVVKSPDNDFVDLLEQAFSHALQTLRLETAKNRAEEALRAANERLAALLREVNHRVANSLHLVSALVQMQARLLSDGPARDALEDTQRRIQAIAQVHSKLYTATSVDSVAMDEYLASMVSQLEETWSTPTALRTVRLDAEAIRLDTDKAVSIGVIVNELVTNACKYAYADGAVGEVRVGLGLDGGDRFVLTVEDDGCGFSADEPLRGTGLGSKLVGAMARALSGTVRFDPEHRGTRAVLTAPLH